MSHFQGNCVAKGGLVCIASVDDAPTERVQDGIEEELAKLYAQKERIEQSFQARIQQTVIHAIKGKLLEYLSTVCEILAFDFHLIVLMIITRCDVVSIIVNYISEVIKDENILL